MGTCYRIVCGLTYIHYGIGGFKFQFLFLGYKFKFWVREMVMVSKVGSNEGLKGKKGFMNLSLIVLSKIKLQKLMNFERLKCI